MMVIVTTEQVCMMMMDVCKALHSMSLLGFKSSPSPVFPHPPRHQQSQPPAHPPLRHRNVRLSHIYPAPDGSCLLGGLHFAVSLQDANEDNDLSFPYHCRPSPCYTAPEVLKGHVAAADIDWDKADV